MRWLSRLVALSPIALLAACAGASSSPTAVRTSTAPGAVGFASARDLSAVRQAAAHTLTLRAAAALEFRSLPSVPYPPIHATGTFDLRAASGQELVHDSLGTETLVFVPARIYDRRPPAGAGGLPHGRPWIRADFDENAERSPFIAAFLLRVAQRDPGLLLAEVSWGARAAAPLGRHTIAGVPADGYLVHVSAARAAAAASGPRAQGFAHTAALLEKALGDKAGAQDVYVWVDRSDRIVAMRAPTIGTGGGTTLVTLSSFGVPVRISPPVRRRTVGLAKLIGVEGDGD